MTDDEQGFVELYRLRNATQGELFRMALQDAGIRSLVVGDFVQGVIGVIPIGWNTLPRLLVEPERAAEAAALLLPLQEQQDSKSGETPSAANDTKCLSCGADMGEADVCSKCGWTFAAPPVE